MERRKNGKSQQRKVNKTGFMAATGCSFQLENDCEQTSYSSSGSCFQRFTDIGLAQLSVLQVFVLNSNGHHVILSTSFITPLKY